LLRNRSLSLLSLSEDEETETGGWGTRDWDACAREERGYIEGEPRYVASNQWTGPQLKPLFVKIRKLFRQTGRLFRQTAGSPMLRKNDAGRGVVRIKLEQCVSSFPHIINENNGFIFVAESLAGYIIHRSNILC
jgi:hypothetical protein